MFISLLPFALIVCTLSAEHTKTYLSRGSNNKDNYYFVPNTHFWRDDACKIISSRKEFIHEIKSRGISCSGIWCNGDFQTKPTRNHYEMEHIIDLGLNYLSECNKNILGNLVLAYGIWNAQVGQLNSTNIEKEKKEIYGSIYSSAELNIRHCCNKDDGIDTHFAVVVLILFLCLITFSIFGATYWRYRSTKSEIEYTVIENNE